MAAAAVAQIGATVVGGIQQHAQAKYEGKVADMNARLANEQAHNAIVAGQQAQQQHWRQVSQLKGEQQAATAANGIDTGFGSALDVQQDTSMLAGEDSDTLSRNYADKVKSYDINAANYVGQAKAARLRGKTALINAGFGAVAQGLSAASQISSYNASH